MKTTIEIYQIILIAVAALCHALMEVIALYKVQNVKRPYSFFGVESWKRKYARHPMSNENIYLTSPRPERGFAGFYYKIFGIKYKEAFPGSATVFVFVTDFYHLIQWFMTKSIFVVMSRTWLDFVIIWAVWSVVFSISFRRPKASE